MSADDNLQVTIKDVLESVVRIRTHNINYDGCSPEAPPKDSATHVTGTGFIITLPEPAQNPMQQCDDETSDDASGASVLTDEMNPPENGASPSYSSDDSTLGSMTDDTDQSQAPLFVYVVTCSHVVFGSQMLEVYFANTINHYNAEIVLLCPQQDLAILRVMIGGDDTASRTISCGLSLDCDYAPLELLTPLYAVGYPLGSASVSVTEGILSRYSNGRIQHTCPINPGNSGGPLLSRCKDLTYRVVGVNSSVRRNAAGMNFAQRSLVCCQLISRFPVREHEKSSSVVKPIIAEPPLLEVGLCDSGMGCVVYHKCPGSTLPLDVMYVVLKIGTTTQGDEQSNDVELWYDVKEDGVLVSTDPFVEGMRFKNWITFVNPDATVKFKVKPVGNDASNDASNDAISGREFKPQWFDAAQITPKGHKGLSHRLYYPYHDMPETLQIAGIVYMSVHRDHIHTILEPTTSNVPELHELMDEDHVVVTRVYDVNRRISPGDVLQSVDGKKVNTISAFKSLVNDSRMNESSDSPLCFKFRNGTLLLVPREDVKNIILIGTDV